MKTATKWIGRWTIGIVCLTVVVELSRLPLPKQTQILDAVQTHEPLQTPLPDSKAVELDYGQYAYTLEPRAEYDLYGLVVAEHTSSSWLDLAHTQDPGNTRDLCVVWGDNITTSAYRKVSYSHGDFTCYYRWRSPISPPFDPTALANNHLIPANVAIQRVIGQVAVGDQIHLRGRLVDYTVRNKDGAKVGTRTTSLTRDDTGNGACEVVLTDALEIIGHGNVLTTTLKRILPWLSMGSAGLWVVTFIVL